MLAKTFAIVKKELKSYFNSPIAYIVTAIFLVTMAVLFLLLDYRSAFRIADLRPFFNYLPFVFIFIIPAITMRSWAEEKRQGTEELLLSLPFREAELVWGKFIAPLILLVVMLLLTLGIPFSLSLLGDYEWGQLFGQYLGVFFFGASCIAVGLFISSLTRNQIVAFFGTAVVLFFFLIISDINQLIRFPDLLRDLFNWISFRFHYDSLSRGLLDTRDLVFFVVVAALFLFLNIKVIIFRKWK